MASATGTEGDKRSRRRGAELEEALLQATLDELLERGYAQLTIDRVAQRAGTNKSVIYRRWPHRAALAFAAYRHFVARPTALPDTGDLRTDVLELLRGAANRMESAVGGEILRGMMSEMHAHPELFKHIREELAQEPGAMMTILGRAVARGEARPASLRPRVATVPVVLLRQEFLMNPEAGISEEILTEIVDQVFLPMVRLG
ncbi:TetR/AcrR family transcriptional regulator [Microbispora hainanensis]|uniref:TetR/AcrR family transcriptional regulator n=1 Tax=Microbispora hainanensis TaxID=568844 RepID=A0A544YMD2_9ACTN|nr:TetR/AcrR family transcriptional regulator [Microbispora hainanensis]TQS17943.1 TetR/AcrR family transcriptional regulator [Microbispora hainanensis]